MCRDLSPLLHSGTVCSELSAKDTNTRWLEGGGHKKQLQVQTLPFLRLIHRPLDSLFFFLALVGLAAFACAATARRNDNTAPHNSAATFTFTKYWACRGIENVRRIMWPEYYRAPLVHLQTLSSQQRMGKGSQRSHVTFEKVTHNGNNVLILLGSRACKRSQR